MTTTRYVSGREFAVTIGVSSATVTTWRKRNQIENIRLPSGRYRYNLTEFLERCRAGKSEPIPEAAPVTRAKRTAPKAAPATREAKVSRATPAKAPTPATEALVHKNEPRPPPPAELAAMISGLSAKGGPKRGESAAMASLGTEGASTSR